MTDLINRMSQNNQLSAAQLQQMQAMQQQAIMQQQQMAAYAKQQQQQQAAMHAVTVKPVQPHAAQTIPGGQAAYIQQQTPNPNAMQISNTSNSNSNSNSAPNQQQQRVAAAASNQLNQNQNQNQQNQKNNGQTVPMATTNTNTNAGASVAAAAAAAANPPPGATAASMYQMNASAVATPIPGTGTGPGDKHSFLVCGARFDVDRKYKLLKPVGNGAYGIVVSAENTETKQKVAIKKITKAFNNIIETKRTLREIKLLRHMKHENIMEVVDLMKPESYDKFEDVYIVSELMNTDLHQIIASSQPLSEDHVQYFVYQILRGLKYIHSAHVLHRDLKPSNLLLNANCDLKICDFGLARPEGNQPGFLTEYVATRWYRAPEIMLSWKEYTKAIDVWSVGCILAEILGRKPLFPGKDYMNQLHLIIDILGTPSYEDTEFIASAKAKAYIRALPFKKKIPFKKIFPRASDSAIDLLERCLTFAPEKRITVEQALAHPYLAALHDPTDEPTAERVFDFDLDEYTINKDSLKALLWNEACELHPEMRKQTAPSHKQFFIGKKKGADSAAGHPPANASSEMDLAS